MAHTFNLAFRSLRQVASELEASLVYSEFQLELQGGTISQNKIKQIGKKVGTVANTCNPALGK